MGSNKGRYCNEPDLPEASACCSDMWDISIFSDVHMVYKVQFGSAHLFLPTLIVSLYNTQTRVKSIDGCRRAKCLIMIS